MIAARSVALALGARALPVLLLFRSEKIRKNQKKSSGSKKNRPPWDPPGGPKSLLEATKLLLAMQIGGSDAFLAIYDRFLADLEEKNKDFISFLVGLHRRFARCLDIVLNLGTP